MDNLFVLLIYIAGLCSVFAVGAFITDVILPRLVVTNKGPRSMARRLTPEEYAQKFEAYVWRLRTENNKQSSPQRSNTQHDH